MADPRSISIDAFDYPLPDARIATHPTAERHASKLLVYRSGTVSDHTFARLGEQLPEDTLLVLNETRVLPVRLFFQKATGGVVEIFLLEPSEPGAVEQTLDAREACQWNSLVRGLKKWKQGPVHMDVEVEGNPVRVQATQVARRDDDVQIAFSWEGGQPWSSLIEAAGRMPLPPYIHREATEEDAERYQPVFSRIQGSVAAPTASLHFDDTVFAGLAARGVLQTEVVLHVGAGTFKPVSASHIGDHAMHREYLEVSRAALEALMGALGRPVIPVGTTALRTIESLYWLGVMALESGLEDLPHLPQWFPYQAGECPPTTDALGALMTHLDRTGSDRLRAYTGLMIAPGYQFRIATGLITNFHQPKSTLLLLVSALIGDDWQRVYTHALERDYRFLSYGDGSLLLP